MMETTSLTLTVFFDDPFWVGVFERADGGRLSVCRVVFGAEPRDAEVLALVLRRWQRLSFSEAVPAAAKPRCRNPKRRQQDERPAVFYFRRFLHTAQLCYNDGQTVMIRGGFS